MKANFDFIAPYYDRLAHFVFGERLMMAQRAHLNSVPKNARILIIGGGTGQIILEVISVCQPEEIIYLEDSVEMLWIAFKENKEHRDQIRFVLGDESYLKDIKPVDAVMSFFFLDVFKEEQLRVIIRKIAAVVKPHGQWLIADFNADSQSYLDKSLIMLMHLFFRVFSKLPSRRLLNFTPFLEHQKFGRVARKNLSGKLLFSEVWKKGSEH